MVQGKIREADTPTVRLGASSYGLTRLSMFTWTMAVKTGRLVRMLLPAQRAFFVVFDLHVI